MTTHADVHRLYRKLVEVLGHDAAETLMQLLRTGYDYRREPPEPAAGRSWSGGSGSPQHW